MTRFFMLGIVINVTLCPAQNMNIAGEMGAIGIEQRVSNKGF